MKRNNAPLKKIAEEWFEKGNHDLQDSKRLYKNGGFTDTICFHCHQAAEKYLKGFLMINKVKPKKVHDLVVLLEDCAKVNKRFKDFFDSCRSLNKYYIEARYPAGAPVVYTAEETAGAIKAAERLTSFITGLISKDL